MASSSSNTQLTGPQLYNYVHNNNSEIHKDNKGKYTEHRFNPSDDSLSAFYPIYDFNEETDEVSLKVPGGRVFRVNPNWDKFILPDDYILMFKNKSATGGYKQAEILYIEDVNLNTVDLNEIPIEKNRNLIKNRIISNQAELMKQEAEKSKKYKEKSEKERGKRKEIQVELKTTKEELVETQKFGSMFIEEVKNIMESLSLDIKTIQADQKKYNMIDTIKLYSTDFNPKELDFIETQLELAKLKGDISEDTYKLYDEIIQRKKWSKVTSRNTKFPPPPLKKAFKGRDVPKNFRG